MPAKSRELDRRFECQGVLTNFLQYSVCGVRLPKRTAPFRENFGRYYVSNPCTVKSHGQVCSPCEQRWTETGHVSYGRLGIRKKPTFPCRDFYQSWQDQSGFGQC